jgi:hypothetical protein
LIAPPANYPVPPEGLTLYGSDLRFTVYGLGLPTMTPEGYDSVIDKIVPRGTTTGQGRRERHLDLRHVADLLSRRRLQPEAH